MRADFEALKVEGVGFRCWMAAEDIRLAIQLSETED